MSDLKLTATVIYKTSSKGQLVFTTSAAADATFKSAKCKSCSKHLKVWPVDVGQPGFQCQLGLHCEKLKRRRDAGKKRGRRRQNVTAHWDPGKSNSNDVESFEFAVDRTGNPVLSEDPAVPVWCENNGENRLCCFEHGYEICDRCAIYLDRVEENRLLISRITGNSISTTATPNRHTGLNGFAGSPGGRAGKLNRVSVLRIENGSLRSAGDAWTTQDGIVQLKPKTVRIQETPLANGTVTTNHF